MVEVVEVLFEGDVTKTAIIAASGNEVVPATEADLSRMRHQGDEQTGHVFNWYECVNKSSEDIELRPDGRTDKGVISIPAKTVARSEDLSEIVYFANLVVVNLDAANATAADEIVIRRRLVRWA